MSLPTVSLITVVFNGGAALKRTLESVFAQSYRPIDYVVIDGGSTDGTLDLIKSFENRIDRWISEPDRGISHAFNKGLAVSTGRYVGFINADDWLEPDQIEKAVDALESRNADFIFGDLTYHDADGRLLHVIKGDPLYWTKIHSRMPALNHPTMLARRTVFDGIGVFDERYHIAMDYDWALRAHLAGYFGRHAPGVIGHMTLEGTSDRRFVQGLAEVRSIALSHGQPVIKAWPLFGFRVVKGFTQRMLQRHVPASLYGLLRGWINRDYRAPPRKPA